MKSLLLNSTYQPISFLSERKTLKLLIKNKVDVLSTWDNATIRWVDGNIEMPAVIRLKYYVRWIPRKAKFNRLNVLRRDKNKCQYCGNMFRFDQLTIDHIVPRSKGGKSTWKNCVASCLPCNSKKGSKSLTEINMNLLSKPSVPNAYLAAEVDHFNKHKDWEMYISI